MAFPWVAHRCHSACFGHPFWDQAPKPFFGKHIVTCLVPGDRLACAYKARRLLFADVGGSPPPPFTLASSQSHHLSAKRLHTTQ